MDRPTKQNAAQKSAQTYFNKTGQDDTSLNKQARKERAATDAKTAKLRALRLAKEAADKEEAERLAAQPGAAAPAPGRKRTTTPKPAVRRFTF